MLLGIGHLEGFSGSVLRAPNLLLRQAGGAALPPGTRAAPGCGPARDPRLQLGHAVPARRLQVREGGVAVPGSAPLGSALPPRPLPGMSRALLNQNLPLQKHLRAEPRRDGAGSASQPWRVSSSGPFGLEARRAALRSRRAEGQRRCRDAPAQPSKAGADAAARPAAGGMGRIPLGSLSAPSASCFTANPLLLLQNKTREPKAPVGSVP